MFQSEVAPFHNPGNSKAFRSFPSFDFLEINPVFLFNLLNYIDKNTGFISKKSKDGKDLKALELPGLWNGATSDWYTIFVEVPLITFNPVKTIDDLLRPEHQN